MIVSGSISEQQMSCMEVWGGNSPTDTRIERPGLSCRIWSRSFGASEAGGDVYFLSSCASGRLTRFLLADVCGHGESAADGARAVRELMRQNVNRLRQTQLVEAVNRDLAGGHMLGRFATALIGTWFTPSSSMVLSNAGHPPPLLYRASTGSWSVSPVRRRGHGEIQNMPLGIDQSTGYNETRIKMGLGDRLLCYTDALSESRDAEGNCILTQGLAELVQSLGGTPTDTLIPRILEELESASAGNLDRDDVTVMFFETTTRPVPFVDSLLAPWRYVQNLFTDGVIESPSSKSAQAGTASRKL